MIRILLFSGISISDERDARLWQGDQKARFHGIDLSEVQDVDKSPVAGLSLPEVLHDPLGNPLYTGMYSGPYFDLKQMRMTAVHGDDGGIKGTANVTAQLGSSVMLPCVVRQVGKNTVSTYFCF